MRLKASSTYDLLPMTRRDPLVGRMVLIHTNAGPHATRWSRLWAYVRNNPRSAARPHFQVDLDGFIAQGVELNVRAKCARKADAFAWSIETADHGAATLHNQGFTPAQIESLARILAELHLEHKLPLRRADKWDGTGVAGHCESETLRDQRGIAYPNTTHYRGKICPGRAKIAQLDQIIRRAIEIAAPVPPLPAFDPTRRQWSLWPIFDGKPALTVGMGGPLAPALERDAVAYLHGVLKALLYTVRSVNGPYDPHTELCVRNIQRTNRLPETGRMDAATWRVIDRFAVPLKA